MKNYLVKVKNKKAVAHNVHSSHHLKIRGQIGRREKEIGIKLRGIDLSLKLR